MKNLITVFTGIQPSGKIHLGNYFGIVKWMLDNQRDDKMQVLLSIADLHSLTAPNRREIVTDTRIIASTLLACGIDPERTILFRQSDIPQHPALMWLLMNRISVNQLERMIQWKLLILRTNIVPVGPDQIQHIEFIAEIARKFNNLFASKVFSIPQPVIANYKVKSLTDPTSKMSKSDSLPHSCLFITDDPDLIRKKISRAVTDNLEGISFDEQMRPGISSLVNMFSLLSGNSIQKVVSKYSMETSFARFKLDLSDLVISHFATVRTQFHDLSNRPEDIDEVLARNADRARKIAADNYEEIRRRILS